MTRKTESLAYPTNPLAAIRELGALDTRPSSTLPVGYDHIAHESPPEGTRSPSRHQLAARPMPATGSAVANTGGSEGGSVTGSERQSAPRERRQQPAGREATNPSDKESGGRGNLIGTAVRSILAQPYSTDPGKGPFTTSTVKIPTEIWERLGWVSAWTARPKQEIIAEALKDYLVKFLKGG